MSRLTAAEDPPDRFRFALLVRCTLKCRGGDKKSYPPGVDEEVCGFKGLMEFQMFVDRFFARTTFADC
ncbi:hypothetical protein L596_005880 [Steinernema carpocapsae]|uniref:Uncharacterized protein n=1 Tax=Steinernema carpocapsae TaxID=34508 RepID=A0A4U8V6M1_STECR|nr:hypothetical protein L596_005880 [Steinernema carpocapsae]